MKEKRMRAGDRRQRMAACDLELPLLDDVGDFVKGDRRVIPDRRINNISVEEVGCIAYITEVIKREKE